MPTERPSHEASEIAGRPLADKSAWILFFVALAVRMSLLGLSPVRDELFHVLAARSLLIDGDLLIEGSVPYTRAWPFTYLVAGLFRVFGESLLVARMPGVVAGAGLVAAAFLWTKRNVGARAAWIAALLLCFDSAGVLLSQFNRFYGLHAFLFFLGTVAVYEAASADRQQPTRIIYGAAALAALIASYLLQATTAIGALGIVVWLAIVQGPAVFRTHVLGSRRVLVGASVVAVLTMSIVVFSDIFSDHWALFRSADNWAQARSGDYIYYHRVLAFSYPTLWSLFPVLAVVAFASAARPAGFCTALFAVPLFALSFGGMKSPRYIYFLMPFFFMLAGMALTDAYSWLKPKLRTLVAERGKLNRWPKVASAVTHVVLIGTVLMAVGSNRGLVRTAQVLTAGSVDVDVAGRRTDWNSAIGQLRPRADSAAVVVSSSPLSALYFLNRLDVSLHSTDLIATAGRLPEFSIPEWYVQRPTISEPESLAWVVSCYPSGLIIVEDSHWRKDWVVRNELADYMVSGLEMIAVPEQWGLHVFRWQTADPPESGLDCTAASRALGAIRRDEASPGHGVTMALPQGG